MPGQHFLKDEYERFLGYLAGECNPLTSGDEALYDLLAADAIVRSTRLGSPVILEDR